MFRLGLGEGDLMKRISPECKHELQRRKIVRDR